MALSREAAGVGADLSGAIEVETGNTSPPADGVRPLLLARDVEVVLNRTQVLSGASIEVLRGEIHVLIGPNGAGKTTLANVLTGHVEPVAGTIELDGRPLSGGPWQRARKGIGRKFQVPRVFPRLTGGENLAIAARRGTAAHEGAGELDTDPIRGLQGAELSHGWRQRLEMKMVFSQGPLIVVLDEPTAGMPKSERQELAEILLAQRGRMTQLIVEHDMDFVQMVADRVSFMHEGKVLATGTYDEVSSHELVRAIYLGLGAAPVAGGDGARA